MGENVLFDARSALSDRDQAWRRLYDEHFSMVYRLACRFGVPASEVEDVTQKVFLIAHRKMRDEEIGNVGGWLRGIVVRVVADHRRWRKVRRVKGWLLRSTLEENVQAPVTPERATEASRARAAVAEVVEKLSDKLRPVLVLCDLEELSPQEVSDSLGIPVNTVRSRRRLARERFKVLWAEREKGTHDG